MKLTDIPRYATAVQSLASKTETTIKINWSSNATIDYLWYSINNGSSWAGINVTDGSSGSYTISNLSPNTAYQVKTRLRRKDSQLTTDSSALSVTTYNYPYCNSMPNFTIGDKLTLGFYNPLGRSVTFYIISNGTQIANNWTISGTSYSGVDAASSQSQLYATIPNDQSATYQVKCVYGSSTITKTGGKVSINKTACAPSISSLTYRDTNETITGITNNNQKIVQNQSIVLYTATGLAVKNSASISSCSVRVNNRNYALSVRVNNRNYALSVSGSTATGGNAVIDSSSNVIATVTLTDSRGLTATKSVTVTMLAWSAPTALISMHRQSNYYSATDLTVDAQFSSVDGKNTIEIKYRYKKLGTSSWSAYQTIQDNVQTTFTADNEFEWNVQVVLTDRFGGTKTYNLILQIGMPLIYFDSTKQSVGFNCFPSGEKSVEFSGMDLFYHAGDTATFNSMIVGGVMSNAKTEILFSIFLPKFMNGVAPTVTAMKLNIRHSDGGYCLSSGYIDGGYDVLNDANITVTFSRPSPNCITFKLKDTTEYNGTNNTPVGVQIATLSLSFAA